LPDELPLELLPGDVAPPVAELGFTPKYEKTLWSQPGFVMSVVGSKAGAVCNLLVSPEYVKVCWPMPEEAVGLAPMLAGCSNVHGTATCFVPPAVELVDEPAVAEAVDEVPVVPEEGVFAPSEMTAKSTLPDCGLIMTSLIVPTESPEEDFTSAPVNWLARISC